MNRRDRIGGGGIFVPVLVLIVGMTTKQAVPISQATIFGGSIANMAYVLRRSHPIRKDMPLVDFSVVAMFTPMLLAGRLDACGRPFVFAINDASQEPPSVSC